MPFKKRNTCWKKANHKNQESWNKGLSKQNNLSLKKQSESLKKHWEKYGHPKGNLGKKASLETKLKMSLLRKGKDNPNWRGGRAITVHLKRKHSPYQKWRKEILERDNYVCQKKNCGEKSNIVHHKISISDRPDLMLNIKNGIVLCHKHHDEIHGYFCGVKQ
jgi:hypothetical protein